MLLTSPPLTSYIVNNVFGPFDLHVLCAPPAFILSQDQTLLLIASDKLRSAVSDFVKIISMYKRTISIIFPHLPCITRFSSHFSLYLKSFPIFNLDYFEFLAHKLFLQNYFLVRALFLNHLPLGFS